MKKKILIGVSSCLLGQPVRFDGGHKKDRYLMDVLSEYFEWLPICPELEVGMGVPRESVKLVGLPDAPEMIGNKSGKNWTTLMNQYAEKKMHSISKKGICGYILKKDSPTCGIERVRVYNSKGIPAKNGQGLYARVLIETYPLLPVEEEGRLTDPALRESFIIRVFGYARLQDQLLNNFSKKALVQFHTENKYLIMAHSPSHYKTMGRFVAEMKSSSLQKLAQEYGDLFMQALAVKTTIKKNINVLSHIFGYLKNHLNAEEKKDILKTIDDYHQGYIPLIVPLTLLKHYISKWNIEYILDQSYLNPHPKELMLRNHV